MTDWEVQFLRSDGFGYKTVRINDCVTRDEAIETARAMYNPKEVVWANPIHSHHANEYSEPPTNTSNIFSSSGSNLSFSEILALIFIGAGVYIAIHAWWVLAIIAVVALIIWILK